MRYLHDTVRWLDHQAPGTAVFIAMAVVLIIVVLVLVLHAARDSKLGRFRFKISASVLKVGTFGMEVESEQKPGQFPPGSAAGPTS